MLACLLLLLLLCACLLACLLLLLATFKGDGCSNIYYYTPLPLNLANSKQASN